MNCSEAEELLGAYALDALPPDEAAAMREHVAGCDEHAEKARELVSVAARLPALADSVQPPRELRYRVLGAIARDAQQSATAGAPRPIETAPSTQQAERRARWGMAGWRGWAAVAAVLAIAVAGLLVWNIVLLSDNSNDVQHLASGITSTAVLHPVAGSTPGTVVYFANDRKAAVLFSTGLSVPQTYQLWQIPADGAPPQSLGVKDGAAGTVSVVVPYDPSLGGDIAVTVEPPGGSPQPTSAPIYSTSSG